MIRIDDRKGSAEMLPLFPPNSAALTHLPFGDFEFATEDHRLFGFERKTLSDIINCISTGRLGGHQLPGMSCRFDVAYILVEGQFRPGADGVLEELRFDHRARSYRWHPMSLNNRHYLWGDLERYLTTLEVYYGFRCRHTQNPAETAAMVHAKWLWAAKRDHHAGHVFDESIAGPLPFREPSMARYMISRLPGIGWKKSGEVERSFKGQTVAGMMSADEAKWREVDGVGVTLSKRIVKALQEDLI